MIVAASLLSLVQQQSPGKLIPALWAGIRDTRPPATEPEAVVGCAVRAEAEADCPGGVWARMDREEGVVREVLSRALLGFIVRLKASQHSMTHEFGNGSPMSRRTS